VVTRDRLLKNDFSGKIVLDSGGSAPGFEAGDAFFFLLLKIEQGTVGGGGGSDIGEAGELDLAGVVGEGDRTVGGAEVDADGGLHLGSSDLSWICSG
jgi:hypothetical protein